MTTQFHPWRQSGPLRFALAAVVASAAFVTWFLLTVTQTSSPALQSAHAEEPILFKKQIQETLAKETVEQSIEHLADFDDVVPNMACMGNTLFGMYSYCYATRFYPNLNRVRKILEESRDKPERAAPILKKKLAHAMDDYEHIVKEFNRELDSGEIVRSRASDFEKRYTSVTCSVYLLSQLKVYNGLPAMEKLFIAQTDMFKPAAKGKELLFDDRYCIANRLFLFCAMHDLVRSHPREKLSPEAIKRLNEYLEASKKIPEFKETTLPSWRAKFDVWDYRIAILNKDLGMDKQPHIKVCEFPPSPPFILDTPDGEPDPKVLAWFAKMKLFIEAAYPPAAEPAPKPKGPQTP